MKRTARDKGYMSLAESRKIFEQPDPTQEVQKVRDSVWKAHWHNARTATTAEQLTNLLKNHVRLFHGEPSGNGFASELDHSERRRGIIRFLQDRLASEFPDAAKGRREKSSVLERICEGKPSNQPKLERERKAPDPER